MPNKKDPTKYVQLSLEPMVYHRLVEAVRSLAGACCNKKNCGTVCLCPSCCARFVLPYIETQQGLLETFQSPEGAPHVRELVRRNLALARGQAESALMLCNIDPTALARITKTAIRLVWEQLCRVGDRVEDAQRRNRDPKPADGGGRDWSKEER